MSESFVDLSYRGLALGKRIKLTQVRPGSGFLEIPTPMPVGTMIGLASEDGVHIQALVAEITEQVSGSEKPPGMLIKPKLDVKEADAWWKARASGQDLKVDKAPPPADDAGVVTVKSPRMTGDAAVPELLDDGRDTGVMEVVPETSGPIETQIVDLPLDGMPPSRTTDRGVGTVQVSSEEASSTTMMDAVDLAALGLSGSSSGQMAAVKPEDYVDDDPGASSPGDKPVDAGNGGGKKKKNRKRR